MDGELVCSGPGRQHFVRLTLAARSINCGVDGEDNLKAETLSQLAYA